MSKYIEEICKIDVSAAVESRERMTFGPPAVFDSDFHDSDADGEIDYSILRRTMPHRGAKAVMVSSNGKLIKR